MFIKKFVCGPIGTNSYLVGDAGTGEALLVDAPEGAAADAVGEAKRRGVRITMVVNTHGHWDHVFDNEPARKVTGAPLAIHKEDSGMLADGGLDGFALPYPVAPSRADRGLEEGEEVGSGEALFKVLHTPGHTPGSICLYSESKGVLFSGDTLFDQGYGRTDLPRSSEALMAASLRRLSRLPADTRFYPGHGEESTIGRQDWMKGAG